MSVHRYEKKKGVGWRAIVQLGPGRSTSRCFARKVDAEAWEREQRQLARGGQVQTLAPTLTVADLADRWRDSPGADRRQVSTNFRYGTCIDKQIVPLLGHRRVMDLTPFEADAWLRRLREGGLAAKTANLALMVLKKMLLDAVRWQLIRFSPLAAVRPLPQAEQVVRFWTVDEATRFLEHVRVAAPNELAVYSLALYAGLRLGEVWALQWDAVDLVAKQITVRRTFCKREGGIKEQTKSKRIRRVPINEHLLRVLIEQRRLPGMLVAPDFDYEHASRRLARLAKGACVPVIRHHDLRHTFASLYVMAGGPIYKLQRLLGHSTIGMTEKYAHLSPEHLADATEILNFEGSEPAEVIRLTR